MLTATKLSTYAHDPLAFWSDLVVECADGTVGPLGEVGAEFQWDFLRRVAPGLLRAEGIGPDPEHWWHVELRHRGASKSSDAVVALLHPLLFSARPIRAVVIACDRDQGLVIRQIARRIVGLNPLLASAVEVQAGKIVSERTGSEVEIMASDVASFYGQLVDVLVADEWTLWPTDSLWTAAVSTLAKRKFAMLLALSNAGWTESWQFPVFQEMERLPHCDVTTMQGYAPWVLDRQLEAQRRMLAPVSFARLWENRWVSGTAGGLDPQDIRDALILDGPAGYRRKGCDYLAGLDVGLRRHHSALVVLAIHYAKNRVEVAEVLDWSPRESAGAVVDFRDIRNGILSTRARYGYSTIFFDRWQLEQLAGELARETGLRMEPVMSAGQVASEQASALLSSFRDHRIAIYDHPLLLDDLHRAAIVERPTGLKVQLAETPDGHGDRLSAMLQALPVATQLLANPPQRWFDDGLGDNLLTAIGGVY